MSAAWHKQTLWEDEPAGLFSINKQLWNEKEMTEWQMGFCWVLTPLIVGSDEKHTIKVQLQWASDSRHRGSSFLRFYVAASDNLST